MIAAQSVDGDLVLIELGGNDLLGSTSLEEFHRDLNALLKGLSAANCSIVMFELPLPPFNYQFGYSQRELAARYDVTLIPKRYLLNILVGQQATLDSIHLTETGHRQMAELVEELLAPAMGGETSN
jgi:acyl-CoA thioesterase-1